MAFVLNLLWFLLGGIFISVAWIIAGLLMCCTIIGIPFGMACFRIAGFIAFPFGKDIIDARMLGEKRVVGTTVANVIWVIFAGLWLAISHAVAGILCFITIIGIPLGIIHCRMARVSFAPLGKRVVSKLEAREAVKLSIQNKINNTETK